MKPVDLIQVALWGEDVGAVAWDPGRGAFAFEYDPRWESRGVELSPIEMPAGGAHQVFVFPALARETFHGLPGLLADALPDRFGNALIDAWMAGRGIRPESVSALDRLAYMGRRGMGALEFRPARGAHAESAEAIVMARLVETARHALAGSLATARDAQAALRDIIRVGTSAGGARPKAVIAYNPRTREIRSGQFEVPEGFEHWLLKFDGLGNGPDLGPGRAYGRIEYACHRMALRAGIVMSPCALLEENGRAHFMTRRFDRTGNVRHHLHSLCGIAHLDFNQRETHGYAQLFQVIHRLGLGDDALMEAFRRMAFNVVLQNCDDHTKNHAFLLRRGGRWELAPAYDIAHAHNPASVWLRSHLLGVNGKFDGITRADLLAVGERFRVPGGARLLDEVLAAAEGWEACAAEAGLDAASTAAIRADLLRP